MELHRWKIPPEAVRQMPERDRALFFLLGHAINEVNVLNKLFYISNQYDGSEKWRQHAHITQGMVLARVLVGKLCETWTVFREGYFNTRLSIEYEPVLSDDAKDALKELGKYYGRKNLINALRNSFAFHYSLDEVREVLSQELNPEELISYMGETNSNTVHYFSEYVINAASLNAISKDDPEEAMKRLMHESQQVVAWLNSAAQEIISVAAERYLLDADGTLTLEPIEIGSAPIAEDLRIPYFIHSELKTSGEGVTVQRQ